MNYRRSQELRELTNDARTHAKVERPTSARFRSIGMTVVTSAGMAVFHRPRTFHLTDPQGYVVTEIVRRMN